MSGLIGEVKEQTAEINNMVQNIDNSIQALDEQIGDVSATTGNWQPEWKRQPGIF